MASTADNRKPHRREPGDLGSHAAPLTKRLVDSLEPGKVRYEVADTRLPGLRLRVTPAGVRTYAVLYRTKDGRRTRYTIGKANALTVEQARDAAKAVLGDVAKGNNPAIARKQGRRDRETQARIPTLDAYLKGDFGTWIEVEQKSGKATVKRLASAFEEFLPKKLPEITTWNLKKWRTQRLKDGVDPGTINRDIAALGTLFRQAQAAKLVQINPTRKDADLKALPSGENRPLRFLSPAEEQRLRTALRARDDDQRQARASHNTWRRHRHQTAVKTIPKAGYGDHLTPMVLLSLNTGLRRGELFNLTWSAVQLTGSNPHLTVLGTTSKKRRSRIVALNHEATETLKVWRAQQRDTDGLVFPSADGRPFNNTNTAWRALLVAAKISRFRWHDMRHNFASRLVEAGTNLRAVQELMGHADIRMTERYSHVSDAYKADAVAKLGAK
jgi:integrase